MERYDYYTSLLRVSNNHRLSFVDESYLAIAKELQGTSGFYLSFCFDIYISLVGGSGQNFFGGLLSDKRLGSKLSETA